MRSSGWLAERALSEGCRRSETGTLSWQRRALNRLSHAPLPSAQAPQGKPQLSGRQSSEVKIPYGTHTSLPSPQRT